MLIVYLFEFHITMSRRNSFTYSIAVPNQFQAHSRPNPSDIVLWKFHWLANFRFVVLSRAFVGSIYDY